MRVRGALKKYHFIEIELLLSQVLGKPKEFLFMHPEYNLTTKQINNLTKFIKRRQKGEPIAYILGFKDFCGLRFKVNKNVLIPRPETEWLVERIAKIEKKGIRVLDLGTGSGCIAITLAQLHPKWRIFASDISKKALEVAKVNAKKHQAQIKFIRSNLFNNIKARFDFIVANLPYVPAYDYKKLKSGLKFEPKLALLERKGLYQDFFSQIGGHLTSRAKIYLEIDPKTKPYIISYTKKYLPKAGVKFYRDLHKFWRYAEITL